jgi:glutaredoxin 3
MPNPTQPSVTVFSTTTCPWCYRVKDYLQQKGVPFTDVNVGQDYQAAMAMMQKSGEMGVPQLWIGEEVVVGFDQRRINLLLGL